MGFWSAARDEAGKQYGAKNAERYARWYVFKRWAAFASAFVFVVFIIVRTWDIGTYIAYGVGALFMFIAVVLGAVVFVRTRRTTVRSYRREEMFRTYDINDVYTKRPVESRTYDGPRFVPNKDAYER